MNYIQIKDLLVKLELNDSIALDIVSSVMCALPEEVSDEDFTKICQYVRFVWDDVERTYTQLVADTVIDCIYHNYEYSECDDIHLDLNNLVFDRTNLTYLEVREAYIRRYYAY